LSVLPIFHSKESILKKHIYEDSTLRNSKKKKISKIFRERRFHCKIADAVLKKGTKQHADGWDAPSRAWAHMYLHLPHAQGGFGVSFNDVSMDAAFYTTARFVAWMGAFSQERQGLWLPKDDLKDASSWSSPPLLLLRDIHSKLLTL
jgi:hypothetical protein